MILMIGIIFVRRCKARKSTGTIGADIIVTGPLAGGAARRAKEEKDKAKSKDIKSSSSSIHSEPLPLYEINETQRET